MKYKHCKRSGVLFVILNIITLRIYGLIYLCFVAKDVNSFHRRKMAPYPLVWILDFLFLGIPSIIWLSTLSRRVEEEALSLGITHPSTGFAKFFNWNFFGSLIIVGPFIGHCLTFRTLNAVLIRHNVTAISEVAPKKEEPAKEEPKALESPKGEVVNPHVVVSYAPTIVPVSYSAPASAKPEQMRKKEPRIVFEGAKQGSDEPTVRKWRVRYANSREGVRSFATQEEAINFAKSLAEDSGADIRVRGK